MCLEAVWMDPYNLGFVQGHLKTQEMCNEAGGRELYTLRQYALDHLNAQEIYNEVVCMGPYGLEFVPGHLRTQEAYDEVVK